jgi:DNA-binding PadR family transcriptional regulator
LQLLQDEGLVRSSEQDGKRVYEITDAGRAEAERRTSEAGGAPWAADRSGTTRGLMREGIVGVAQAAQQLARTANESQLQRATEILRDTRKRLYQILGED